MSLNLSQMELTESKDLLSHSTTEQSMKENGMTKVERTDEVFRSGLMAPFMKDTGRVIRQMDVDD